MLYIVQFGDVSGPGYRKGGVVILDSNRLFGGDSGFYYLGSYAVDGDMVTGVVEVTRHDPSWTSAFADYDGPFKLQITAQIQGQDIVGWMLKVETGVNLPVRLQWVATLP